MTAIRHGNLKVVLPLTVCPLCRMGYRVGTVDGKVIHPHNPYGDSLRCWSRAPEVHPNLQWVKFYVEASRKEILKSRAWGLYHWVF